MKNPWIGGVAISLLVSPIIGLIPAGYAQLRNRDSEERLDPTPTSQPVSSPTPSKSTPQPGSSSQPVSPSPQPTKDPQKSPPKRAPGKIKAEQVTDEEIGQFVGALLKLQPMLLKTVSDLEKATVEAEREKLEQQFESQASQILQERGLTVEQYRELVQLANGDPGFKERVNTKLAEESAKQPSSPPGANLDPDPSLQNPDPSLQQQNPEFQPVPPKPTPVP
jgi:hypothetical protein